ncbi:MAG TPA: response regulator [Vicinamibacterales bacterium]|nr:response regulator [Vicinamibacterales bacterium]
MKSEIAAVPVVAPHVLLVDDHRDTREMYGWSLEARGFAVSIAGTVSQAAALASARRPDVIVTDFFLPGQDGFALASHIRESAALHDTALVLVSGRTFVGNTGDHARRLFDRVLLKPVLPDDLIAEIVPLMLDRAAATLQRQVREVRQRVEHVPDGSTAGCVMTAVTDIAGETPTAALLADSAAQYIAVNDAACYLTGRSREELLSMSVWDLTPQIDIQRGQEQWARFIAAGTLAGPYRLNGPTGSPIDAIFSAVAHVLPDVHLSLLRGVPSALLETRPEP